jgi:hypothetical protein
MYVEDIKLEKEIDELVNMVPRLLVLPLDKMKKMRETWIVFLGGVMIGAKERSGRNPELSTWLWLNQLQLRFFYYYCFKKKRCRPTLSPLQPCLSPLTHLPPK